MFNNNFLFNKKRTMFNKR